MESDEHVSRADGTAVAREEAVAVRDREAGDVEKDSYHLRTEKRWDEAFVSVQAPAPAPTHRHGLDPGVTSLA